MQNTITWQLPENCKNDNIMKKLAFYLILPAIVLACSRDDKSDAYGNFDAVEVNISSEASGRIIFLNIEEGKQVATGDTIGLIDTIDLSLKREQLVKQNQVILARINNLESQVKVQEQQKKNILVEKERVDKLFKEGAATSKQVDDINGSLDLVEQQILATEVQKEAILAETATLKVQVGQVDESIRKCLIISPMNGTVLTKFAEPGEVTTFGRTICKMADLTSMELKVYITGDQLPYLKISQKVTVLIDKDKKEFRQMEGTVSWISNKAEFTPKTIQTKKERVNLVYAAKVTVPNDGSLKIGMPGEINFMGEE